MVMAIDLRFVKDVHAALPSSATALACRSCYCAPQGRLGWGSRYCVAGFDAHTQMAKTITEGNRYAAWQRRRRRKPHGVQAAPHGGVPCGDADRLDQRGGQAAVRVAAGCQQADPVHRRAFELPPVRAHQQPPGAHGRGAGAVPRSRAGVPGSAGGQRMRPVTGRRRPPQAAHLVQRFAVDGGHPDRPGPAQA
ncbi:hypothetical protein D3C79_833360 [compost metagenome]